MGQAFSVPHISADGHFSIPEGTTTIVEHSWEEWQVDKKAVKTVTIPDSVSTIGESAFNGCSSLTSITIPDSVTAVGVGVFFECSSLASITIPDSVITIGKCAFEGCSSLASITIPDSVTTIEYQAFYGCSSLTSITIPDSVTTIGDEVFYYCSSLASITIPDSVTTIGDEAFWKCSSLASVAIGDSVATIGLHAFYECTSLASITIPDSVTTIGDWAFFECSSLASITIPDSVAIIKPGAFYGCTLLATLLVKSAASFNGGAVTTAVWNNVFKVPERGDEGEFFDDYAEEDGEDQVVPLAHVTRIWAPNAIVNQLTGSFAAYATFADIPRAMRAAPDATTWAAVELWLWWSPPTEAGYTNRAGVCKDDRIVCKSRHATLFAATMAGFETAKATSLPPLPPPIWLLVFGFVKHDEPPAYAAV